MDVKLTVDWAHWANVFGVLQEKLAPYMSIFLRDMVATPTFNMVVSQTPETRPNHTDIRALWIMEHDKQEMVERYIIRNTYKNPDVLLWFEEGTRPHRILPTKPHGLLVWENEETGETIFCKGYVSHPGTKAYHMAAKGRLFAETLWGAYLDATTRMVDRIVEGGG